MNENIKNRLGVVVYKLYGDSTDNFDDKSDSDLIGMALILILERLIKCI